MGSHVHSVDVYECYCDMDMSEAFYSSIENLDWFKLVTLSWAWFVLRK